MELVTSSTLPNVTTSWPLTVNAALEAVRAWAGLGCEPGPASTTKSAKPTKAASNSANHVPLLLTALLSVRHRLSVEGRRIKGAEDLSPCLL